MAKKNSAQFTVSVKMNKARINELVTAAIKAVEDTADFIQDKLVEDAVIPYATGQLQESLDIASVKKGSFTIYHTVDYADDVYYSSRTFSRQVNAKAQSHWMDYLLSGAGQNEVRQHFIEAFRKRGKV